MNSFKNILFDLDGTMIEPEEGIINSIVYSLEKMGIEEPNKKKLKDFIGPPLIDSFSNFYNLNHKEASQAVNYYREYFSRKGLYQNTLYDGIEDLLNHLRNKKYRLFIATSKPTVFAEKILVNFNLDNFFDEIVGSNLDNTRKDKSDIIQYVLSTSSLLPTETIMIGDRKFDITGAKLNSLTSIGVTYGHGSLSELKYAKADYIVNSCKEIQDFFN